MKLRNLFKRKEKAYHHVFNVTDDNFDVQVMQRSFKSMIMVDFWAPWCGPCRQLGPVLERIAIEPDAKFLLAKHNTENHPRQAQVFGVKSIPTVRMIRNGTVIGMFNGLQIEANIRRFVDEKYALPAPRARIKIDKQPKKRLASAKRFLENGDGFRAALALRDFPDSEQSVAAQALEPLAGFLWDVADGDGLTGIDELDNAYLAMASELRKANVAGAVAQLQSAENLGEAADQAHTQTVLAALHTLQAA